MNLKMALHEPPGKQLLRVKFHRQCFLNFFSINQKVDILYLQKEIVNVLFREVTFFFYIMLHCLAYV